MPSKAALAALAARAAQEEKEREEKRGIPEENLAAVHAKYAAHAKQKVEQMFAKSKPFQQMKMITKASSRSSQHATFDEKELVLGKILGRGGFCAVTEVTSIRLLDQKRDGSDDDNGPTSKNVSGHSQGTDTLDFLDDMEERRMFISKHAMRHEGLTEKCRFAIKKLRPEVVDDSARFIRGMMDMGIETHLLSLVDHPNIIKIRAVAGTCEPYDKNYFIMLDRLYEILDKKFIAWRKQMKKSSGKLFGSKKKVETLLDERLGAAYDISSALEHLHSHNIIYRDLKPENIGFDVRGDAKIFDFGLAKEVYPEDKDADGNYLLTKETGSLHYMAPEVFNGEPYNFSVDAYSFSILLWEIMALKRPYEGFAPKIYNERVVQGGARPTMDSSWPSQVRSLISKGWSADYKKRPNMEFTSSMLRKLLTSRTGDCQMRRIPSSFSNMEESNS